jgi:hypothetical protein
MTLTSMSSLIVRCLGLGLGLGHSLLYPSKNLQHTDRKALVVWHTVQLSIVATDLN